MVSNFVGWEDGMVSNFVGWEDGMVSYLVGWEDGMVSNFVGWEDGMVCSEVFCNWTLTSTERFLFRMNESRRMYTNSMRTKGKMNCRNKLMIP